MAHDRTDDWSPVVCADPLPTGCRRIWVCVCKDHRVTIWQGVFQAYRERDRSVGQVSNIGLINKGDVNKGVVVVSNVVGRAIATWFAHQNACEIKCIVIGLHYGILGVDGRHPLAVWVGVPLAPESDETEFDEPDARGSPS